MENYLILGFAAIIGVIRGAVSLVFEHPLDVVKTYWQAHPAKSGIVSVISEVRQLKGWRGFYSGAIPNVMRVMLKQAYRYPLMIALPAGFAMVTQAIFINSIATGLSIALIEVWIITPLERLKVWLITFRKKTGGVASFIYEVKTHCFGTLYKGLKITTMRQIATWVTFLVTHDQLMALVKHNNSGTLKLSLVTVGVISVVEGIINTAVILPLDCIKTNQQKESCVVNISTIETAKSLYHQYGLQGFYVGFEVRLIQYVLHSAFTVAVLENLRVGFKAI